MVVTAEFYGVRAVTASLAVRITEDRIAKAYRVALRHETESDMGVWFFFFTGSLRLGTSEFPKCCCELPRIVTWGLSLAVISSLHDSVCLWPSGKALGW